VAGRLAGGRGRGFAQRGHRAQRPRRPVRLVRGPAAAITAAVIATAVTAAAADGNKQDKPRVDTQNEVRPTGVGANVGRH
jgi:hypothetical protein